MPVHIGLDDSGPVPRLAVVHEFPAGPGVRVFGPYLGGSRARRAVSALERVFPLGYAGGRLIGTARGLAEVRDVRPEDRAELVGAVRAVLGREPEAVARFRAELLRLRAVAAESLAFERAARVQAEIEAVDWLLAPQQVTEPEGGTTTSTAGAAVGSSGSRCVTARVAAVGPSGPARGPRRCRCCGAPRRAGSRSRTGPRSSRDGSPPRARLPRLPGFRRSAGCHARPGGAGGGAVQDLPWLPLLPESGVVLRGARPAALERPGDWSHVFLGRTVVHFRFPDVSARARDWWLVITAAEAEVCDIDPGHPVTVQVSGGLRELVEVWRGDLRWADALRSGALTLDGPRPLCRALPGWFTLSPFAAVPRPAPVPAGA